MAQLRSHIVCIEGGDWTHANLELTVTEESIWENFVFHGISDCVNVHFVDETCVFLRKRASLE